ncbi:uncharacterized protein LOC128022731 [Carassius gibelio]|uniref:uncharacterized protein LOC128022731 n=1 Tax=Carassius gibelio TaxID=101364 RepID=UPI002277EB07|nr:uncharacterized protein LOC128022731 [Carassius gibelio]
MASAKSHKGMSNAEWLARLESFAQTGVWPSTQGNRPSPRQKRWHEMYQKIEKCPLQMRGQTTLLKEAQTCICGFHKVHPPVTGEASQSTPAQSTPSVSDVSCPAKRPKLTLSMFEKSRFGGSHVAAAKPNLSTQRKTSQMLEHSSSATVSCPPSDPHPPPSPKPHQPVIQSSSSFFLPPPQSSQRIKKTATPSTVSENTVVRSPQVSSQPEDLPLLWPQTMPQQDQKWVSEALFRVGAKGKLELRENLQLWYHPPPPALLYHQAPTPDRFFSQRLLLWMPYKLWKVRLQCTNPACARQQLCGGGLHRRVRQVLDIDRYYNLVTETLICTRCRTSYLSWSQAVLQQLDLAHRSEFRVILTRKYACDIRVLRLLRERGMGNGPVRIIGQLRENHSEEWLKRALRYTSECVAFFDNRGLHPLHFQEPPPLASVPSYKWLLTVYSQDILNRLDHIKASITSTYGSILKMDSTKKITKKLSGPAKGTAQWLTSVGNEIGQVLMSVLTANEGAGLDLMAAGLMERYRSAGVDPPTIIYVDCDCCKKVGETKLKRRFSGWPDVIVRLDIWHFMRRLAVGCTTDAHQLYPTFMARLSSCIFEWDAGDLTLLRQAKREQLIQQGWPTLSEAELDHHLTKAELLQHCRRRTRGEETTFRLLDMLIRELMGGKGNDALGVPLLDSVRMQHIWNVQRRHITCIQDPPNVPLYTETGTTSKGGVVLKTYRCARGSTSLESFHCHLNRFIPGNSANSLNFQIYLLEGLLRWNQDRAEAAVADGGSTLRSYTGELVYSVNENYNKLYGRKLVPSFTPPAVYTGELIGVQYLLRQNSQPLEDMCPTSDRTSQLLEEIDVEEQVEKDEGFIDFFGEEATVANLVASDDLVLSGPPVLPAAPVPSVQAPTAAPLPSVKIPPLPIVQTPPLPSVQTPPLPSVQTPPLPSVQTPPLPSVQTPPLPSVQTPPLPSVQTPPLPSVQAPPLLRVRAPSTAPVPSVAASLLSVQAPPLFRVRAPSAAPVPSVQAPPLLRVRAPSAAPVPSVAAPLPSVQTPPLPSVQAPPLLRVRAPSAAPVPSVAAPLPSVQTPPLPSVQAPPLLRVRAPSAAPVPSVAASLLSVQAPPLLRVRAPSAAPVPSVQDPLDTPVPSAMAVDEHCIPGMDRVDALAECLVELRTQTSLTLTNQQVATIVGLWQNLDKFDKDRVVYAARHQDRLLTGRFRSPKKKAVFTPGVDSTKRCVLGSSGSPAQWPNCCRLVEMIFIRLCNIHRSPKKQRTECLSRWDLILRDYRKIRQLILSNGTVMSDTTLQLVEVNQRTLTTWHNNRLKGQEVSLLLQGLDLPEARPVALDVLPPARVQPVVPPQYSHQLHTYQMPPDTAGQAKTKFRKIAPSATCTSATATSIWPSAVHPQRSATSSQLRTICPRPTAPHPLVPDTPTAPVVSQMFLVPCPAPFSTINPGAISSEPPANDTATPTKRSYNRTVKANSCRKCGQFRTQETGHSQYKGKIYCPNKETITKEQWLQIMRR